ncbi:MAG TPA: fused MFS/spermidine synthase [Geomonas sp.]|nr:fused MFS/spermidine synthase [Geomonas sp.]
MNRFLIFLIAGWSGFFLMAVELLSGRMLSPNFGSSIQVWGAIITVFMLALSVGYLLGGRLSIKDPSLARLAAILLATAAATAPTVLYGDAITEKIFIHILDPRYGSLASALLLFFLPTMIAGMVSPYAVRLLVSECRLSGHYAGFLYFVSTFGSAAGTILTSFYLVLILDMNQIFWILIGVSTTLGLLSLMFSQLCVKSGDFERSEL